MLSNLPVKLVRYKQIATWKDCQNALPTDEPAVYAWFQDLTLSETVLHSEEKFVDTIMQWFMNPQSEKREAHISPFYEVGITIKSKNLSSDKEEDLRQYAHRENTRREIGRVLEAMSVFQSPLYIGKADKLADRIWDHIDRKSGLRDRLETAGLSLDNCLLAYVQISKSDGETQTSLVRLVEDIITRLSRPGFVLRIG